MRFLLKVLLVLFVLGVLAAGLGLWWLSSLSDVPPRHANLTVGPVAQTGFPVR